MEGEMVSAGQTFDFVVMENTKERGTDIRMIIKNTLNTLR